MEGTFSIILSPLVRCEATRLFQRWLVDELPLMATSQTMGIYGNRGHFREIVAY